MKPMTEIRIFYGCALIFWIIVFAVLLLPGCVQLPKPLTAHDIGTIIQEPKP